MKLVFWFFVALLTLTETAQAGPVIPAISAFASTAIGGFIVKAVIGLAISIGTSLLKGMMTKKQSGQKDPGTSLQLQVGGDNSLFFPLGRAATGGVRVYCGTWTGDGVSFGKTPNEYAVDVIALSAIPLSSTNIILWMNDQKVTVLTSESKTEMGWPINEYRYKGKDYAWIDFFDGTQTTTSSYLLSRFGSHPDYPWQSDMIGRGVAYAIFTARYQSNGLWSGGFPSLTFELPSIKLYDIRKDSTAGGSGTHRWNNPSTWQASNNNMVRAYNVMRGIYYGDEWVYGGQDWPAFRLPAASWMAGMNACDLVVGGVNQFHGGGMIECDVEAAKSVEELLRGASGLIAEVGGVYKIRIGAPGAAVFAFTDDNIIVTREQGYSPFPGLEDTYNIVRLSYTEPAEKWASKEAPERRDATMIASDDNRELPMSVELPWTLNNPTAQRIGLAALLNGRRFRRHQHYLPPEAWLLEPLDVVSWSSAHNGYVNKTFDIEQISGESTLLQGVTIRENDPTDYDWNPETDELPYTTVPLIPSFPAPQQMTGWQVQPAILKDNDGEDRRPSIQVFFDAELTDVARVRVQVRLDGDTNAMFDGEVPYDPFVLAPSVILQGQFLPNTDYQARGIFVPYTDRQTEWSDWLDVTTPNVLFTDKDVYLPGVLDGVNEIISDATKWVRDGVRQTILEQQRIARLTMDQDFGDYTDRQKLRTELVSVQQGVTASYSNAIVVATGPNSALSLRIEELTTYVNDVVATAISTLSAEIDAQGTALSQAITALSAANTSGDVATANFRMTATAGPDGVSARIAMEARAGGVGAFKSAGLFIDVPEDDADPSRVVILADQFVVADPDDSVTQQFPLIFQDGELTLNVANIGTVNAGLITNPGGKMNIDIDNGTIEIYD
ncbi:putative tail protein [Rhizobium phage RHph_TM3_3_9]|nr:putative tail protein [Rhizobium phage RHph_TM3_3_9]QIG68559.1 putative tail protein [Rhizobium phage RHph_TM3_3_13]QIG74417.1 putative tail protein [Rhizobium phage RHph_TM3_3_10]QXV74531.1 putative tail protein [Rhizobium phage RHEph19]